jgi:hypothetical protein
MIPLSESIDKNLNTLVYNVIKYGIIIGIFISLIVLVIGSVLVHDTTYIEKNPKFFISETFIMGILTTVPILYITYLRGGKKENTLSGILLFFMKIVLIHIGFQLSGVYTVLFG